MLQLGYAPHLAGENLLMARTDQQQRRQHRHATGLLDAALLLTNVVLVQSEVHLQLALELLHWPSSLRYTHHLSRRPLVPIGHEDFRMVQADVTPFFSSGPL